MNRPVHTSIPVAAAMIAGLYALMLCVVALVAAAHPDPARRTDASAVLDRLLRFGRRR
jgi:hypothetical protein